MPCLKEIIFNHSRIPQEERGVYPFTVPALQEVESIRLNRNVTFFIGENGSGKSTLLEALAKACDFNALGGQSSLLDNPVEESSLASILRLSWFPKLKNGFFFRSETFFNFASYIEEIGREWGFAAYGGKSLHRQSHGESFIATFTHRFSRQGLYLLDEPEAALSPQNQLAFLRVIRDLETRCNAQFIIATHSPILLGYPDADIFSFDSAPLSKTAYEETPHYRITLDFLLNRELFLNHLFQPDE